MIASGNLSNNINNPANLSDRLDLDNISSYDLVFIDYNNGTDDIKRNEILFQNVVYEVNKQKAQARAAGWQTYDNVVLGSSMGGLVTRYGLADIVRNGFRLQTTNHNPETRILVTHDSPHHGANIPLAIQFLARRAETFSGFNVGILNAISGKDLQPVIDEVNNLLDAPAPQQMLIYQAKNEYSSSVTKNVFLSANGEYRAMVDNIPFAQYGLTPYSMIALSNGSQCGTPIFAPGVSLLNAQADGFLNTPVTSLFPLQFGLGATVRVNASSMQTLSEVAYWQVYAKIRIYLLFFTINRNITLNEYHANSPSYVIAYDGSAGGTTAIPLSNINNGSISTVFGRGAILHDFLGLILNVFVPSLINLSVPQKLFSFIPTGSALDADNFIDNPSAVNQNFSNNFNSAYPPKFRDGFILQNVVSSYLKPDYDGTNGNVPTVVSGTFYNTPHISFQPNNSIFLYEKLTNSASTGRECSTECSNYFITGPSSICNSGGTYSINSGGAAVTWTATPSNVVNIQSTSIDANSGIASVTLVRNNNSNGYISVTASFQSGACTITSTPLTNIEVGTAIANNFTITGPVSPCKGTTAEYHISPYQSDANYSWSCSGTNNCGSIYPGGISNNYADFVLPNYPTQNYFTFTVLTTRTNYCGTNSVISQSNFHQFGTGCSSFMKVALSPNPASNILNIKVEDSRSTDKSIKVDESFQVTISDVMGNVQYNNKHSTVDTQIDISNLKTGNYSLRILKAQEVVTQTFSVAR